MQWSNFKGSMDERRDSEQIMERLDNMGQEEEQ